MSCAKPIIASLKGGFRFPLNPPYDGREDLDYELVEVAGENEWRDYHTIRREVLWEARGRASYNDKHGDEYLPANHPLLLKLDGRAIGTTPLDDLGNGTGAARLMAIIADLQRRGHGRKLAELIEAYARNRHDKVVRKRRLGRRWLLREARMATLQLG